MTGIPAGATGRVGFRYYVTDGGPSGSNSNYIGIDTFEYASGVPQVCSSPADVPWLSEAPVSGTIPGGGSQPDQVTFDSTGLGTGIYSANLCVESNDPDPGPGNGTNLVVVPVSLEVVASQNPAIELNKTGVLLRGIAKEEVERGQVLAKTREHNAAYEIQGRGLYID